MAFWDETPEVIDTIVKKKVWRIEIDGDLDDNFRFIAHLQKVRTLNGVEVSVEDLGEVVTTYQKAVLDPNLEPTMNRIRNNCRSLIRLIRNA